MRWFGGITAILLVLGGGLAGVGLLLPTGLEAKATREIARPRATVYTLASNLDGVKAFLPINERDPQAQLEITGSGEDARLAWSSKVSTIGAGSLRITKTEPLKSVVYTIAPASAPPAVSRIAIAPAGGAGAKSADGGVVVTWTYRAECDPHWRAMLCRYAQLLAQGLVKADLAAGLQRLERLALRAPAADFEGLTVRETRAPGGMIALVEAETANQPGRQEEAINRAIATAKAFVTGAGLQPSGAPVVMPRRWTEETFAFSAGEPFAGPPPLEGGEVKVATAPEGRALMVTHSGPYSSRIETYARFEAYLAAHMLAPVGEPWEVLVKPPADDTGESVVQIWRLVTQDVAARS